jgi:hypothetical protein
MAMDKHQDQQKRGNKKQRMDETRDKKSGLLDPVKRGKVGYHLVGVM